MPRPRWTRSSCTNRWSRGGTRRMRLFMIIRIAWRALGRNKARTFLTMLGIIIGVAAVITMVALGQGAREEVQDRIRSLGTNVLYMWPGAANQSGVRAGTGTIMNL